MNLHTIWLVGLELCLTGLTDTLVQRRERLVPSTDFPNADKTPST